ncbi:MAG TPA: hypothetical protein VGO43_00730 [Pyrinomonadaceae bacterium]|nr:hypothetical protein [Pyrinomonadaceae bacterium]
MADEGKCAHDGCNCSVSDSKYCSDHCREVVDQDIVEISCDCGHGGCA